MFERYAWWALLATVALVPLAVAKAAFLSTPVTYAVFGFPQNVALAFGTTAAAGLWAVALLRREITPRVSSRLLVLAAFPLWAAVSTLAAYEPARSFFGTSTSSFALVQILACATLAFLAVQMVDSRARMSALTWSVVGSSTFVAVVGLGQQYLGVDVFGLPMLETWMTDRGFSTLGNPDQLGNFLVFPAVLSLVLALFEQRYYLAGLLIAIIVVVMLMI
jgi:hypothetical protein